MNRNKFLQRSRPKRNRTGSEPERKQGMFHDFPAALRDGLLIVSMKDAPSTCSQNNEAIEAQRQCKLKKRN